MAPRGRATQPNSAKYTDRDPKENHKATKSGKVGQLSARLLLEVCGPYLPSPPTSEKNELYTPLTKFSGSTLLTETTVIKCIATMYSKC